MPDPAGVTLSQKTMALGVGASKALTATVTPVGAPQSVIWQTLDLTVASVSSTGLVEAKGAGSADIVATTPNGISAVCKVTVKEVTP